MSMTSAKRTLIVFLVGGVGYLLPLIITGNYRHSIMAFIAAYAISAVGFTFLVGVAGQISLAQGSFMAIGGYTSAYLSMSLGMSPLLTVPITGGHHVGKSDRWN